jgi:hypothetical protein
MWFLLLLLGELHRGGGVSIPEWEGVFRDAAVQDATSSTPAAQPAWSFESACIGQRA